MTGDKTGYNSPLWLHVFTSSWCNWTKTKNTTYLTYRYKHTQVGRSIAVGVR